MRNQGKDRLGLRFVDLDEGLRQRLIARLFSDASVNVASKAEPAMAFGTLLRRSLLGERRSLPSFSHPPRLPSLDVLPGYRAAAVRLRKQPLSRVAGARGGLWGALVSPLRALFGLR